MVVVLGCLVALAVGGFGLYLAIAPERIHATRAEALQRVRETRPDEPIRRRSEQEIPISRIRAIGIWLVAVAIALVVLSVVAG